MSAPYCDFQSSIVVSNVAMCSRMLMALIIIYYACRWKCGWRKLIIMWYNTQSSAPEDGQNNCPKHVELTGIINKPLLLHLVGCLFIIHISFNIYIYIYIYIYI